MIASPRIMLVDDEPGILSAIGRLLRSARQGTVRQFVIESFTQPEEALDRAEQTEFDLVLSDYRMPGMDGIAFLTAIRQVQPRTPRLIMSGQADLQTLIAAVNVAGVVRFISKPWHEIELYLAIQHALDERRLLNENERLVAELDGQRRLVSRQEGLLRRLEAQWPDLVKACRLPEGQTVLSDP